MALFGLSTLIFARIHHLRPSPAPSFISSKCCKFSSTELSLLLEAMPFIRSSRIYRHAVSYPTFPARLTNLHLLSIVRVGPSKFNQLDCKIIQGVKVV